MYRLSGNFQAGLGGSCWDVFLTTKRHEKKRKFLKAAALPDKAACENFAMGLSIVK